MDTNAQATICYKLFHPRGPQVTFTSPQAGDARDVIAEIDALLAEGWSYLPPDLGLMDTITITHAIRNLYTTKKGKQVERLLLYATFAGEFGSTIKVWLDSAPDINRFESASGLTVADMPLLTSKDEPNKDTTEFNEFAVPADLTVNRMKEESAASPVGYKWVLVDYVGAVKPQPEPAPQQASAPPADDHEQSQAQEPKSREGAVKGDLGGNTITNIKYLHDEANNDGKPFCKVTMKSGQVGFLKDINIIRKLGVPMGDWTHEKIIQGAGWFGAAITEEADEYLLVTAITPPLDWDALAMPQAAGF